MREIGKNALKTVLTREQNVNTLEKYIFEISEEDEKSYKKILYETIQDISNGNKIQDILSNIKNKNVLWKHKSLETFIKEEEEQDEFIINPFQVEEGIVECRCGSKRVYSYSKQCRGGDESSTTFATCLECKSKWTYSG